MEALLKFFVVLFVVVDPPSLAPLFAAMTEGGSARYRRKMALKASAISLLLLVVFALGGSWLLGTMGISIDAFRIGGGIMLFLIALDMVFAREEKTTPAEKAEARLRADISVFPLAFPLIAGPGTLATVLMTFGSGHRPLWLEFELIAVMVAVIAVALAVMLATPYVMRVLGVTGANVAGRVAGVLLGALGVQFIIDGLKGAFGLVS